MLKSVFCKLHNNRSIIIEKLAALISLKTMKVANCFNSFAPEPMLKRPITTFWWTGCYNFGDLVTPALLRHYGLTPVLVAPERAKLAATGSILGMLGGDYSGAIIGSGLLSDRGDLRFPDATIAAVRGELTRARINAPQATVLGDPGLLLPDLLTRREAKKYALGVIPHYEDMNHPFVVNLKQKFKNESVQFINVLQDPVKVCRKIDQCEVVISSSLHGCIVADALLVPNCWVIISNRLIGGKFKFHDYYTSIDSERHPITVNGFEMVSDFVKVSVVASEKKITNVKTNLRKIFFDFVKAI